VPVPVLVLLVPVPGLVPVPALVPILEQKPVKLGIAQAEDTVVVIGSDRGPIREELVVMEVAKEAAVAVVVTAMRVAVVWAPVDPAEAAVAVLVEEVAGKVEVARVSIEGI
jgi:hypothetical protein